MVDAGEVTDDDAVDVVRVVGLPAGGVGVEEGTAAGGRGRLTGAFIVAQGLVLAAGAVALTVVAVVLGDWRGRSSLALGWGAPRWVKTLCGGRRVSVSGSFGWEVREFSRADSATEERVLGCWTGAGMLPVPGGAGAGPLIDWEVAAVSSSL